MKKNHGLKLLKLPTNHNHIQARIDRFIGEMAEMDLEQMDLILGAIEQYLLDCSVNLESQDLDPWAMNNAAFRISEGRYWLSFDR